MTITITARDSDGDGTGVEFSTFFSTFYQEFAGLPSQYGSGHQYGVYQENGSSILFNGTVDWVIDPENSGGTTGNFNQIVFGGDFQPAEGAPGTNSADLTIDFPQVIDASTHMQDGLGLGNTDKLMTYLKADALHFVGSTGDDAFTGFSKPDVLDGNGGDDMLSGAKGKDTLDGGRGDDTLSGGAGVDTFVFARRGGKDTVTDFAATGKSHDIIDPTGLKGINSFKDVTALLEHHHQDVWIDAGHGDVLVIKHAEIQDLTKSDFVF